MRSTQFFAPDGLLLAADVGGNPENPAAILLHGGGQTRFSWGETAAALANNGFYVVSLDLRGHGDSGWSSDGIYDLDRYASDLLAVCSALKRPAALIGASLGGLAALLAAGESDVPVASAVILVDVAPHIDRGGSERIGHFMRSAPEGFTTLEEAADAVAAYLPHRPRPANTSGLKKNLRPAPDGRLYWHWDPRFLHGVGQSQADAYKRLSAVARKLTVPALLVRGSKSELVTEESVRDFLGLVPEAEYAVIQDAHHMVAGDRNTAFSAAVIEFMQRRVHHKPASRSD